MDVDESVARQITTYQGQIHYFCAPGCKKAFKAEPQKYLGPTTHVSRRATQGGI